MTTLTPESIYRMISQTVYKDFELFLRHFYTYNGTLHSLPRKLVFPRNEPPDWLSNIEWLTLETYTGRQH